MAGLSNALTNKQDVATTLPSWFSTAQQNVVSGSQAQTAPTNTVAQSAINAFGPQGAFTQGQNALSQIAAGAASPWITDANGNVTPNTATPLGGLYKASEEQLNQFLPQITAAPDAAAIGAGGFGSLRNKTASDLARGNAIATMNKDIANAALQSQQYGTAAGAALGNLGNQATQQAINTATYQQNAPWATAVNQANILKGLGGSNVGQTQQTSAQLGALNQVGALGSLLGGGVNALADTVDPKTGASIPGILTKLGISGGLAGALDKIQQSFTGGTSTGTTSTPQDYGVDPNATPTNPYNPIDITSGTSDMTSTPDWWWTQSYD